MFTFSTANPTTFDNKKKENLSKIACFRYLRRVSDLFVEPLPLKLENAGNKLIDWSLFVYI